MRDNSRETQTQSGGQAACSHSGFIRNLR